MSKELVSEYNALASKLGKPGVKRFASTAIGQRRLAALKATAGEKKASPSKTPRQNGALNLPFRGLEHKINAGTLNELFIEALTAEAGASLRQLAGLVERNGKPGKGTPENRAMSILKLLHTYNGYGIREKEGRFFLRTS